MIVTKLQGGLGNQLFQWAVTKSLSLTYSCDYFFDVKFYLYQNSSIIPIRKIKLNEFENIKINVGSVVGLANVVDDFRFKKILNNSYLDGYWQSEKYFKEYEDFIRQDLEFNNNVKKYVNEKYNIDFSNTISLHIRRCDYVKLPNHHPVLDVNYYKKAINLLNGSDSKKIIFSDDINWCKNNLNFLNCLYIEGEDEIIDLYLMSKCENNIIANSSFSWWGAWLNSNKNKKVIAPKIWFGSAVSNWNSNDLYCDDWIII